jgi:hypothetical protein
MHPPLENELLMQVAAGTDLPTALAALPSDEATVGKLSKPAHHNAYGWVAFGVLVAIVTLVLLR